MGGEKECVANPIKFETGRNLLPLLKLVTHNADAALTIVAKHIFSMVHSFDWSFYWSHILLLWLPIPYCALPLN